MDVGASGLSGMDREGMEVEGMIGQARWDGCWETALGDAQWTIAPTDDISSSNVRILILFSLL